MSICTIKKKLEMNKNIYIYYEFYKREFLSNLLLAVIASKKKNFKIYIGTNDVFRILHKKGLIAPGIFHTKSLTHGLTKKKFHEDLKKKNFILTSIDQEHGVANNGSFYDLFIKPRVNQDDLRMCNAFFCWGKYDFNHYKKNFKDKNFYLTGSPRVDLWKPRFKNFWRNKKVKKNYILFVSNFSFTNNFYSFKEILKRKEMENYYKRSPKLKKEEIAFYKYQTRSMKKFIKLIINFSKKFPSEKIIVRPHPTEKKDLWEKVSKKSQNISIKYDGDLSSYIRNAECVVQDGCTSAFESYISNIPVINFVPIKTNKNSFGQFIKKFSINITNEKKFFNIFKSKKYKILKKKKYIVNNRMIYLNKKLSATKIVNIWYNFFFNKKFSKNFKKKSTNNNFKIFIYLFILQNLRSFLTNIILTFKRKWYLKNIIEHKNQGFDINDVNRNIDELTKSIKIKNNVNVSKLGKDLILITSQ
jgi:surface carbohydrate biosynthesis protein